MDMTTYLLMRDRWGGSTTVNLQNKSVTPSDAVQYISADSGYDGLSMVTLGAIPSEYIIPSGTISISANGNYNVEAFASAEVLVRDERVIKTIDRTISEANFPEVTEIGNYAFQWCSQLTSINFPNVTKIGKSAFCGSVSSPYMGLSNDIVIPILEASFPKAVEIGSSAFYMCCLLSSISFPKVESIGDNAFCRCSSLTEINFPSALVIYSATFQSCFSLKSAYFPKLISMYGSFNFENCSLTTISFPKLEMIAFQAFRNCIALEEINFPSVLSIFYGGFSSCTSLKKAYFSSLEVIYDRAFAGCYNLLSLYLLGSSFVTLSSVSAFYSTPISTYTTSTGGIRGSIYVRASMYASYKTQTNWATYSSRFVSMTDEEIAALNI